MIAIRTGLVAEFCGMSRVWKETTDSKLAQFRKTSNARQPASALATGITIQRTRLSLFGSVCVEDTLRGRSPKALSPTGFHRGESREILPDASSKSVVFSQVLVEMKNLLCPPDEGVLAAQQAIN